MLKSLASFVDRPIAHIALALLGLAITILFCLLSLMLLVTPESGWLRLIVIGGMLGLVGWWVRIFTKWSSLPTRSALRNCVVVLLFVGIIATVSSIFIFPGSNRWYAILGVISALGLFLLLASLASKQIKA